MRHCADYKKLAGFNPRPPRGERLDIHGFAVRESAFQSTPPERGATNPSKPGLQSLTVSIHAPREGSDIPNRTDSSNVHTFQSTPPERGATADNTGPDNSEAVSIHAPREGSDETLR